MLKHEIPTLVDTHCRCVFMLGYLQWKYHESMCGCAEEFCLLIWTTVEPTKYFWLQSPDLFFFFKIHIIYFCRLSRYEHHVQGTPGVLFLPSTYRPWMSPAEGNNIVQIFITADFSLSCLSRQSPNSSFSKYAKLRVLVSFSFLNVSKTHASLSVVIMNVVLYHI